MKFANQCILLFIFIYSHFSILYSACTFFGIGDILTWGFHGNGYSINTNKLRGFEENKKTLKTLEKFNPFKHFQMHQNGLFFQTGVHVHFKYNTNLSV